MAPWKPNENKVENSEIIGRRIFGDDIFDDKYEQGIKGLFRVDHFFDDRLETDLSVDRIGEGNINKKVRRHLESLAVKEGEERKPPRSFKGWAACHVKLLRAKKKLNIGIEPRKEDNTIHHAEILRDNFREYEQAYALAFMLRDYFTNRVGFEEYTGQNNDLPAQKETNSLFHRLFNFLKSLFTQSHKSKP